MSQTEHCSESVGVKAYLIFTAGQSDGVEVVERLREEGLEEIERRNENQSN